MLYFLLALGNEVSGNVILLTIFSVCIGRIDLIGRLMRAFAKKFSLQVNAALQTSSFIKGIVAEMFNKINSVYLQHIYLDPKLYRLCFFSPNNRTNVRFAE